MFVKHEQHTALKVEFDGDYRVCCCLDCCKRWFFTFNDANVTVQRSLKVLTCFFQTTAERTPTCTNTVRLEATVKELGEELFGWASMLGIAQGKKPGMPTLDISQSSVSLSRKSRHLKSNSQHRH